MSKDYKIDELLKDGKVKLVEVTNSDDGKQQEKEINLNEHHEDGYKFIKTMFEDIIIRYGIKK
ncbi:hypothetical protein [Brachyspira sp. G79]|uniref:hypothetical protein n=1 Tax=Brachyspira sp. G79 TaxID=1358104 RepID=UPI000BBBDFA5|nr:hypothetical protein [Brachyspira sp. G79]PCG20458.1 hypothetical protein KQ44_10905 [Brachyspira sp. G79]